MKQRSYYLSDETIQQIAAIARLRDNLKYNAVVTVAVRDLYDRLFHGPSTVTIAQAEKATEGEKNV